MNHSSSLTPAELERLAYLMEQIGKAGQAIGKVLRHGYESYDPKKVRDLLPPEPGLGRVITGIESNRSVLEIELGNVLRAVTRMSEDGDLRDWRVKQFARRQFPTKYMYHQSDAPQPDDKERGPAGALASSHAD